MTMTTRWAGSLAVAALAVTLMACGGDDVNLKQAALDKVSAIPSEAWKALAERRIFFGHQSVGAEIMDGVAKLAASRTDFPIRVLEGGAPEGPGFRHGMVGENKFPQRKIDGFREVAAGAQPGDIYFFKFCYIDIQPETDVDALFEAYRGTLATLRESHPGVTFVHVTSPLTTVQPRWKVVVKRLFGRPQKDYAANAKRAAYNDRLRAAYAGKEPVFDLAAIESKDARGRDVRFPLDGALHPALAPEYSYDGRHLDEEGRLWVAANLLETLSGLPR
jgi:hypothetical protein